MARSTKEIFADAVELPFEQRAAFVAQACGDDVALKAAVESLLAVHAGAGAFLGAPTQAGPREEVDANEHADALRADAPADERPGTIIGRYRLVEQIGEGGFGVVFLAEQREPIVRNVALKVIKLGMDTKQVIARFEAERQALAMMDHPNIAKVFDAGATAAGRPYFAMELVRGEPITKFCDQHNLSTEQRLALFIDTCHAVQHAHQKGIIHRDLKPSNVLVTLADGRPVPKVIDFGVAKATRSSLTEKTVFTERGALIGTLEYMSPEQAESSREDVDTRSDIYSLGVLLYELLTGTTPFEAKRLRSVAFAEIQRIIREVEPQKPSTRISTMGDALPSVAAHRHTEPSKLSRRLRGDLDWIVMKSLEKDRARRYETSNALALDLLRHLHAEPVVAAPPSASYRFAKFVRRHKLGVFAGAAICAALVIGIAGAVTGLVSAQRAREFAQKQQKRAESAMTFVTDALRSSDPTQGGAKDLRVSEAMLAAMRKLDAGAFGDDPEIQADLLNTIGVILAGNQRLDEALPLLERALAIRRDLYGGDDARVADTLFNFAFLRESQREFAQAESLYVQALEMRKRLFKGDDIRVARCLDCVGRIRDLLGRAEEAEPLLVEALAMFRRISPADDPYVATGMNEVARIRIDLGRAAEAEYFATQALEMSHRLGVSGEKELAPSLMNLANVRIAAGRVGEAELLLEKALAETRKQYEANDDVIDDAEIGLVLTRLATLRGDALGRLADAEPLLEESVAIARRFPSSVRDPPLNRAIARLAHLYRRMGRAAQSEPLFNESLELTRRLLAGSGRVATAAELRDLAVALTNHAVALQALGRDSEAEPLLNEALGITRDLEPDLIGDLTAFLLCHLAQVTRSEGKLSDAELAARKSVALYEQRPDWPLENRVPAVNALAQVLAVRGPPDEAVHYLREAIDLQSALAPNDEEAISLMMARFAALVCAAMTPESAAQVEPVLRDCVEIRTRLFPDGHPRAWLRHNARSMLGGALVSQAQDPSLAMDARLRKFAEAEPLLHGGYNGMKDDEHVPTPESAGGVDRKREALERIVHLYETWNAAAPAASLEDKAAHWRAALDEHR